MRQLVHFLACVCVTLSMSMLVQGQKPELVVQTGHSKQVNSVAFSPDGRTLASGSDDNTINLVDVRAGRVLRTFFSRTRGIASVAFSTDGKILAGGGIGYEPWEVQTITLWDVATGVELRTLRGHTGRVVSVTFTPDDQTLISASFRTIKFWDVKTGAELRTLKGHDHEITSMVLARGGKTLASASAGGIIGKQRFGEIKLWDVASGRELNTLARNMSVRALAFSPDGAILASGNATENAGELRFWNINTGGEIRVVATESEVHSVAFSRDGRFVASGTSHPAVKPLQLWDVADGRELGVVFKDTGGIWSVAFGLDGVTLVSGNDDGAVRLWHKDTGEQIHVVPGTHASVTSVAFSRDGKTLVTGGDDRTIKFWDLATNRDVRALTGHRSFISTVAFRPDSKWLASGGGAGSLLADGEIKLWELNSETMPRTLKAPGWVWGVAFSPDNRVLASGSGMGTIKLWDVATGDTLSTLYIAEPNAISANHGDGQALAFSHDGRILAVGDLFKSIRLWDVMTGHLKRTLIGHSKSVTSVAFSPVDQTLASSNGELATNLYDLDSLRDDMIKLWDAASGSELRTLRGHKGSVRAIAFSPDGRTLASGGRDTTIKLWEVATGTEIHTFTGHTSSVTSVAFSPDGRILASGSRDATTKLWDVATGKEIGTLIAGNGGGWLFIMPDGLFDGTPAEWNQILWRYNQNTMDVTPVEAYFGEFYYPGLLADTFAGKRPRAPSEIFRKDRRQPQLKLSLATPRPSGPLTARNTSVRINVSHAPAGAQDVRLFRNGSLVKSWRGDVLKGQSSITLEAEIPIVAGENRLTAYAFNLDNIKSSDATLVINGSDGLTRAGTLYLLSVGVGQYANANYNLKYTPADAQDFGDEMRRQQELLKRVKLGRYEQIKVIPLLNQEATKVNIMLALRRLTGADYGKLPQGAPSVLADLLPSQPEDGVVLYFSGHGTAQKDRFYLIPYDIGYSGSRKKVSHQGVKTILAHSISDIELEEAFREIDARELLLVIDACNSGQALQADDWRRGPMNTKGLAQLAYEKGMYVLTASQSVELAYESEALKHSFMTYALIEEGLKSKVKEADANRDGQVLLREWFDYAAQRVPRMREEKIEQTARQLNKSLDAVEVAEQGKVQSPRVFYRREPDARPWIVAQSK